MDISGFQALLDEALREADFRPERIVANGPDIWTLPSPDIMRFFVPHAVRKPWGFRLTGGIGIDIPTLRDWLSRHAPGAEAGIFRYCFLSYPLADDDVLGHFDIVDGRPVPMDLWVGLVSDRLAQIPPTLPELLALHRRAPDELGWLGAPMNRPVWEFLHRWNTDRDAAAPIPRLLSNGHAGRPGTGTYEIGWGDGF